MRWCGYLKQHISHLSCLFKQILHCALRGMGISHVFGESSLPLPLIRPGCQLHVISITGVGYTREFSMESNFKCAFNSAPQILLSEVRSSSMGDSGFCDHCFSDSSNAYKNNIFCCITKSFGCFSTCSSAVTSRKIANYG